MSARTSTIIEKTNAFSRKKNRLKLGSPCMYPIEYSVMSDPTPVTNRHHRMDSGSSCRPALTWSEPTGIQVKMFLSTVRSLAGRPSIVAHTITVQTNEPAAMIVASQPDHGSRMRRPPKSSTRAPASGSATIR